MSNEQQLADYEKEITRLKCQVDHLQALLIGVILDDVGMDEVTVDDNDYAEYRNSDYYISENYEIDDKLLRLKVSRHTVLKTEDNTGVPF